MTSQESALLNLVRQLAKAKQDRTSLETKCKQLEGSLLRAENRIAQLNLPTSGKRGILTPGVSKKVLESLTKENTNLKRALEQVTNRRDGPDLAIENKDLHEIILTLRDDRDERAKGFEQLKQSLAAIESKDKKLASSQVALLTFEVQSLQKQLRAKNLALETVFEKYDTVMKALQEVGVEKVVSVDDLREKLGSSVKMEGKLGDLFDEIWNGDEQDKEIETEIKKTEAEIRSVKARTWDDGQDEQAQAGGIVYQACHDDDENEKAIETKIDKLKEELEMERREKDRLQEELAKAAPPSESVLQQLNELQEALEATEKQRDELLTESAVMKTQISGYEDEFKMERQEKEKAMNDRKGLEANNAKLIGLHNKLQDDYNALMQRVQMAYPKPLNGFRPLTEPCCRREPDAGQVRTLPVARPRMQPKQFECPTCHKMFPHDELEYHMRSCY